MCASVDNMQHTNKYDLCDAFKHERKPEIIVKTSLLFNIVNANVKVTRLTFSNRKKEKTVVQLQLLHLPLLLFIFVVIMSANLQP